MTHENEKIILEKSGKLNYMHWFVIALSGLITISAWYITKTQIDEKVKIQFHKEAEHTIELITERMKNTKTLSGAASLQSKPIMTT